MSSKSTAKPVDQAEPTLKQATRTDAQKVNVAHATTTSMAQSPLWGGAGDVQSAAKAWSQSADDLDGNAKVIANIKLQLAAAEAKQLTLRRNWRVCKRHVLSTVSIVCAGSADAVKGFSFAVITRTPASLLAAVEGITSSQGAATGEATIEWPKGLARNGFLVQHATNAADATTYSAPIACTKTRYTLAGASPSGSSVSFRVAAVDPLAPSGQSPWSVWVAATVR